jgi:hypothetical protein
MRRRRVRVDYTPYLLVIIQLLALNLKETKNMANNFDRLVAAIDAVSAGIAAVAEAIRNPAVDNNDQVVIDELAGRLEASAALLSAALADEQAEDGGAAASEAPSE